MRENVVAERVILVDNNDHEIGACDKLSAHYAPRLHRAFSVFVFDGHWRLLMQRRAADKYHSGGLWSNTCCGHPRPGDQTSDAAGRRLFEEMGFRTPLRAASHLQYNLSVDNGLTEHEYNHLFVGRFDGVLNPNIAEVDDWRWVSLPEVLTTHRARPCEYSRWFRPALRALLEGGV